MEVCFVTRYNDSRTKGIGNYSKFLYEGLKNHKDVNLKVLTQDNATFKSQNAFSYMFYSIVDLKLLLGKKEYANCDIHHAMTPMESLYIDQRKGIVNILDLFDETRNKENLYGRINYKYTKKACECENIVVLSENTLNNLKSEFNVDEDKVTIITPSISSDLYEKDMDRSDNKFIIGTISGLGLRKRIDILIKAFLDADMSNSELWIGGTGEECENLRKLAGNDKRIKFLGFVADEKMNDFYNSLDLFVFPTVSEGYGMPMVEAMACKKPVITLNDADIPESIREHTFVTTKNDLAEVLKTQSYYCDIEKNYKFSKEHSIENRAKELVNLYKTVI